MVTTGDGAGVASEGVAGVAVYEFRCRDHGAWEEQRPLGTAPDDLPCPECGGAARRTMTVPRLSRGSRGSRTRMRAIEATEASADAPPVVTALPSAPRTRRRTTTNPALRHLPRP